MSSFVSGFVSGILFVGCGVLLAVLYLLKKVKADAPAVPLDDAAKELPEYLSKLPTLIYDAESPHEAMFQSVPEQAEPCAWFNLVIVRIMMEYRASNFEEKWCDERERERDTEKEREREEDFHFSVFLCVFCDFEPRFASRSLTHSYNIHIQASTHESSFG
jgi:hypothetical protein